jgi:hypothetical protein
MFYGRRWSSQRSWYPLRAYLALPLAAGARNALSLALLLALIVLCALMSAGRTGVGGLRNLEKIVKGGIRHMFTATDSTGADSLCPREVRISPRDGSADDIGGHGKSDMQLQEPAGGKRPVYPPPS